LRLNVAGGCSQCGHLYACVRSPMPVLSTGDRMSNASDEPKEALCSPASVEHSSEKVHMRLVCSPQGGCPLRRRGRDRPAPRVRYHGHGHLPIAHSAHRRDAHHPALCARTRPLHTPVQESQPGVTACGGCTRCTPCSPVQPGHTPTTPSTRRGRSTLLDAARNHPPRSNLAPRPTSSDVPTAPVAITAARPTAPRGCRTIARPRSAAPHAQTPTRHLWSDPRGMRPPDTPHNHARTPTQPPTTKAHENSRQGRRRGPVKRGRVRRVAEGFVPSESSR
jgi:hypothetical protein